MNEIFKKCMYCLNKFVFLLILKFRKICTVSFEVWESIFLKESLAQIREKLMKTQFCKTFRYVHFWIKFKRQNLTSLLDLFSHKFCTLYRSRKLFCVSEIVLSWKKWLIDCRTIFFTNDESVHRHPFGNLQSHSSLVRNVTCNVT